MCGFVATTKTERICPGTRVGGTGRSGEVVFKKGTTEENRKQDPDERLWSDWQLGGRGEFLAQAWLSQI